MKIDENRGRLEFEEQRICNTMGQEDEKQGKVHAYMHKVISQLEVGTDTVTSKNMALDRRIGELEHMIGVRACVDETTGRMIY